MLRISHPRNTADSDRSESMLSAGPQLSGTNLERAGDHNQRVTLHAVRVNGPVTRTELVLKTGLTPAAIANITNRLLARRLILRAGRIFGGRGQPAGKFVINPDGCFSIGLNVDRDHITLVVLDFVGRVRARASREICFAPPATVRTFFQRSVGQLLAKAGISRDRLVGVGVALPDDIARAYCGKSREYAAWASVRIDELIGDVLDLPVFIENDAAAAAIGEMQFGAGQRYRSFFYLLVTAALGGGFVADGSYLRGANGRSGEIGWLRARDNGGEESELQNLVSLSCVYGRLAEKGFRVATPRGLMRLRPAGRLIVDRWIDDATQGLVNSFVAINCLINPQAILIGGRLPAELVDRLVVSLNRRMAEYAPQLRAIAPVARAETSDDAPAVGAAILPFSDRLLPTRFALLKTPYHPPS
jgi:predicted NBD/HSP70 family sugar kinase